MDGVLVNSEVFWQQAEKEVFSALGVPMSAELCEQTRAMTTQDVCQFWFDRFPWEGKNFEEVEQAVVEEVIRLIKKEDCLIPCVKELITLFRSNGFKIGLATNSPEIIIPVVLEKTGLETAFDAIASAATEEKGKPDPAVYLSASRKLGVAPQHCLAIEDSHTGLLAAQRAGMRTVGFTNQQANHHLEIADILLHDFCKEGQLLIDSLNNTPRYD
jgi:sugar-phosphatase